MEHQMPMPSTLQIPYPKVLLAASNGAGGVDLGLLVELSYIPQLPHRRWFFVFFRFLASAEKISATIYRTNACQLCKDGKEAQ
jgi:hypothetical protein